MCEAIAKSACGRGADLRLGTSVRQVNLGQPHCIEVEQDGEVSLIEAEHIWSTIPITTLARIVNPPAPASVIEASGRIKYRAMILIYLVLDQPQFSQYDAHYFPETEIKLTRLSSRKITA
ncbi:MAG: FAD-dependent oxidoreductase [Pyrinomonadaceae bacterium]